MNGFLPRRLHPAAQLLLLVVLMLAGACVGLFLVFAFATLGLGLSATDVTTALARPADYPQGWSLAMGSQGLLLLCAFGGAALALARLLGWRWGAYFSPRPLVVGWAPLAAAALIIIVLPAMSVLIAWNANVQFPDFMGGFAQWARDKEEQARVLTAYLTRFTTVGRLLVGLLVIGVVPAVAEELVFRGVVQRNLVRWTQSRHAGIWLAAAVFSAIHVQFFGFVPRFVLGLVLGYLYEWSGNILVPMAAHFTQNAFQLLMVYLSQHGGFGWGFDPDSTEALPLPLVAVSVVGSVALLWLLHRRLAIGPQQMLTLSHDGVAVQDNPATD